jgi:hypothetical protein
MKASDQRGMASLVLPLGLTVTLLVITLIFAVWAFAQRQDYKSNVDKKIATAVVAAEQAKSDEKDKLFAEQVKNPLTTYKGPTDFGALTFTYPKTWNALISDAGSGSTPVDAYFYNGIIPSNGGGSILSTASYALRVQILSSGYDAAVKAYDGAATSGKAKVVPYKPTKVNNVVGVRIDGALVGGKTGAMVILPLRDKTIELWTEDLQYVNDFNTNVLPSVSYEP